MNRIHQFLVKNLPSYDLWHKAKFYSQIHFIALTIFVSFMGYIVYGQASLIQSNVTANKDSSFVTANINSQETLDLLGKYASANNEERSNLYEQVKSALITRKNTLLSSLKSNPISIIASALPESIKSALPLDAYNDVENAITTEGTVQAVLLEDFPRTDDNQLAQVEDSQQHESDVAGEIQYYLTESTPSGEQGNIHQLYFTGSIPQQFVPGARVSVNGITLGNTIVVDNARVARLQSYTGVAAVSNAINAITEKDAFKILELPVAAAPIPVRQVKVLVIPMNFSNDVKQPWTKESIESNFFTGDKSTKKFYDEATNGKVNVTGLVADWVTVPYVKEDYSNCTWNVWLTQSIELTRKAGVKVGDYPYTVLLINKKLSQCPTGGFATLGTPSSENGYFYLHGYNNYTVFSHELGHNLGLNHSNSIDCKTTQITTYSKCTVKEYGDPTDVMGYNWTNYFHFNGAQKSNWWLESNEMKEVTQPGTYTVVPIEKSSGLKVLEIKKQDTNEYYTVSYRAPIGFDAKMNTGYMTGASIHIRAQQKFVQTKFIDTTPGDGKLTNATLADGRSFFDETNNIKITQISHTAEGVTVKIEFAEKKETVPPTASVTLSKTKLTEGVDSSATVKVVAQDESGIAKIRIIFPNVNPTECTSDTCEAIFLTKYLPVGSYTVTVEVTDKAGNYKTYVNTITISSKVTPTPVTPTPTTPTPVTPTSVTPTPTTPTPVTPTPTTPVTSTCPSTIAVNSFTACYYNNSDFTSFAKSQVDPSINFNWERGSPVSGVETFSIRWTGSYTFEAGAYDFRTTVDDGVRIYVDGQLIIDQWKVQSAHTYTTQKVMTAGRHEVKVEYYEYSGNASILVDWSKVNTPVTPTPVTPTPVTPTPTTPTPTTPTPVTPTPVTPTPTTPTPVTPTPVTPTPTTVTSCPTTVAINAFTGCYYENSDFTNLAKFQVDPSINFNWGKGSPVSGVETFSIRWVGNYDFEAGAYNFRATVDDGVRMYIDGQLIIDKWVVKSATTYTTQKVMTAGRHEVKVEYYENSGYASAVVDWSKASTALTSSASSSGIASNIINFFKYILGISN